MKQTIHIIDTNIPKKWVSILAEKLAQKIAEEFCSYVAEDTYNGR